MPTDQASMMPMIIQFALIIGIFYFLIFRPQKKKQDDHKSMLSNLKKGDSVITAGGMHGTVASVTDATVILNVDKSIKLEFDKESISTVKTPKTEVVK